MTKPPYRVPSMAEVAKVRGTNGLKVVSTFSGCGGSCLGFEMAGYDVVWASEFVEAARETYKLNHPGVPVDPRDIREVTPEDILEATGLAVGELDVFEGSPPCAAFSSAGSGPKGWGKVRKYSETAQRVDDLFFEYARLLKGLQPRTFVAENVAGLVRGTARGYFKEIMRALKACGYRVEARLLDAKWLGVPQSRRRLIFMGVREDLARDPVYPAPLPYFYSVRDALPWIDGMWVQGYTAGERKWERVTERGAGFPSPTILSTGGLSDTDCNPVVSREDLPPCDPCTGRCHESKRGADFRGYAIEREWLRLKQGQGSNKYLNLARPHVDRPSPCVTATGGATGAASVTHPTEPRKFYICELRRVCGFPDDFETVGSFKQQWERLGRSVPPVMMRAVASTLRDELLLPLREG